MWQNQVKYTISDAREIEEEILPPTANHRSITVVAYSPIKAQAVEERRRFALKVKSLPRYGRTRAQGCTELPYIGSENVVAIPKAAKSSDMSKRTAALQDGVFQKKDVETNK